MNPTPKIKIPSGTPCTEQLPQNNQKVMIRRPGDLNLHRAKFYLGRFMIGLDQYFNPEQVLEWTPITFRPRKRKFLN